MNTWVYIEDCDKIFAKEPTFNLEEDLSTREISTSYIPYL